MKRPHVDGEDFAAERVIPREKVAEAKRQAQDPLAHRYGGQHVVDEMCGALGHPTTATRRTHGARFARERYQPLRMARLAAKAGEAAGPHATSQELAELALDERRDAAGALGGREKRGEMRAHDAVEHRVLGGAGAIRLDRSARLAVRVISRRRRERRHRIGITRAAPLRIRTSRWSTGDPAAPGKR